MSVRLRWFSVGRFFSNDTTVFKMFSISNLIAKVICSSLVPTLRQWSHLKDVRTERNPPTFSHFERSTLSCKILEGGTLWLKSVDFCTITDLWVYCLYCQLCCGRNNLFLSTLALKPSSTDTFISFDVIKFLFKNIHIINRETLIKFIFAHVIFLMLILLLMILKALQKNLLWMKILGCDLGLVIRLKDLK